MGQVIINYLLTALYVLLSFSLSWLLAYVAIRKFPKFVERTHDVAFLLGTGLLLVAGIGRLGWSIQTLDGTTSAEALDQDIFWVLSVFGTVLLVFEFAIQRFLRKRDDV